MEASFSNQYVNKMLSILRRSDETLFKFLPADNAQEEASHLQAGHCFEVNIIASIRVDSKRFLEAIAQYHTSNGWFRVQLDQLLSVWLDCLDVEESETLVSQEEPNKNHLSL